MIVSTRLKLVPFVLCAMGAVSFALTGCKRDAEPEGPPPPANSPAVYMRDPEFRKALREKREELQAIVSERKPLMDRMQELVREHGENLAGLQKIDEWKELHGKVTALNERYETTRRKQLKYVAGRLTPPRKEKK